MNKTFNILTDVTKDVRKSFIAKSVEYAKANLNQMVEQLRANDWDLDKVAPRPSTRTDNQWAYREKSATRNYHYRFFKSVESVGMNINAPTIVKLKFDAVERMAREAEDSAAQSFDKYIHKLAGKIGDAVTKATLDGNLWSHSILTVTLKDGAVQKWKTMMIINRSIYGKLFNQFPTKLIK